MEPILTPGIPVSSLPFTPAIRAAGLVFVSGQGSVDDSGQLVPDSFEGEMRRSVSNLERVLAGAGLGLADVAQVRAYVDDRADLPEFNRIYRELFPTPFPTRTTLIGCLGGVLKFEIDAIAVDPGRAAAG